MVAVFIERQHLHRNMPRRWILLQVVEDSPAQHVRQKNVQRNGCRVELARQGQRIGTAPRHQDLEPVVMRKIAQDARVVRIVFDNQ